MTAHPRVDPVDGSLIFYSTQMFDAPHARYSVIDRYGNHLVWKEGIEIGRAKMSALTQSPRGECTDQAGCTTLAALEPTPSSSTSR